MKKGTNFPTLKQGMMVQCADGDIGMVFGHLILFMVDGKSDYLELSSYNDQLEYDCFDHYNIQRVTHSLSDSYILNPAKWSENIFEHNTLWSRKPETIEIPLGPWTLGPWTNEIAIVECYQVELDGNTYPIELLERIIEAAQSLR